MLEQLLPTPQGPGSSDIGRMFPDCSVVQEHCAACDQHKSPLWLDNDHKWTSPFGPGDWKQMPPSFDFACSKCSLLSWNLQAKLCHGSGKTGQSHSLQKGEVISWYQLWEKHFQPGEPMEILFYFIFKWSSSFLDRPSRTLLLKWLILSVSCPFTSGFVAGHLPTCSSLLSHPCVFKRRASSRIMLILHWLMGSLISWGRAITFYSEWSESLFVVSGSLHLGKLLTRET